MAFLQTADVQCNQDRRAWHFHKHLLCNAASTVPRHQAWDSPKTKPAEIGELTSSKDRDTRSAGELAELLLPGKAPRQEKRIHA